MLPRGIYLSNLLHPPQYLTVRNGQPQVFFSSPDPLAPGAVAGQNNIYEWSHDQVFRLASGLEGTQGAPFSSVFAIFGGASEDGSDVYVVTPETLELGRRRRTAVRLRRPHRRRLPAAASAAGSLQRRRRRLLSGRAPGRPRHPRRRQHHLHRPRQPEADPGQEEEKGA